MKKNNMKFVLIPAFAAAALFPVLADGNQAKANDDKTVAPSTVNNTVGTSENQLVFLLLTMLQKQQLLLQLVQQVV